MQSPMDLPGSRLADAWAELQAAAVKGEPLAPDAHRLAFADPEFLLRRETRGIRFQLEMLKPDLAQQAHGIDRTVVVFGSARCLAPDEAQTQLQAAQASGDATKLAAAQAAVQRSKHYADARAFAQLVAQHSKTCAADQRLTICTGGGPGIMEAANRGAHDEGVPTVGLSIALPFEASGNRFVTPELNFKFHYFALRKMHFMMRAVALVAFPGGFGTLDELFEVLTLVQTGKAQPVPIVLHGSAFWRRLIDFDLLVAEGMISPQDVKLFRLVDTPQDAWHALQNFTQA